MSASIGASATGARAYTATASQGLLYMTEALYNASGLGLPIVMTVANRAIGAPINIWNDHSDSMSQRDSRLDPAVRRDQPGGARPAHPGVPPGRGALHAGDGLHGRLHPHPRRRARRDARRRSRSTRSCRRFEPRQVLDPDEPITIGAMVGPEAFMEVKYLAHAKQMQALELIPEIAADFERRLRARLRWADAPLPQPRTPRRSSWRSARCSARSRTPSMSCASEGVKIGVVGITSFRPFPLEAVRAALGQAPARARAREGARRRHRRDRLRERPHGARGHPALHGYTVIAGLGGRPITKASLRGLFSRRRRRAPRAADVPRHGLGRGEPRARADALIARIRARTPRTSCATSGAVAAGPV